MYTLLVVKVGKGQAGDRTLILMDANMGVYMVAEGNIYLNNQPSLYSTDCGR